MATDQPVDEETQADLDDFWPADSAGADNTSGDGHDRSGMELTPDGESGTAPSDLAAGIEARRLLREEARGGSLINPTREGGPVIGHDPDVDDNQLKQPDDQGSFTPPALDWRPPGYARGDGAIDFGPDADIEYHGIPTDVPAWVGREPELEHLADSVTGGTVATSEPGSAGAGAAPGLDGTAGRLPPSMLSGQDLAGVVDLADLRPLAGSHHHLGCLEMPTMLSEVPSDDASAWDPVSEDHGGQASGSNEGSDDPIDIDAG